MATSAPLALTSAWQKLVDADTEFFLSFEATGRAALVEVAISDTEVAPGATIRGHVMQPLRAHGLTRHMIGPGYLYGRLMNQAEVFAVLTKWT